MCKQFTKPIHVITLLIALLFALGNVSAQQDKRRVTGIVTDPAGTALPGVMVTVQNTSVGTVTNSDGLYVIDVGDNNILRFSLMSFITKDVPVGNINVIDVVLEHDVQQFEEVVVVGYGKQKKAAMVAAVSSVPTRELSASSANFTANLSGQIAGLISVQRSSEPGRDDAEFWIRGISSNAGGTAPLIIVDGVPRSMSDIEPDEIDTFNVLKDASATAVYGAEGANGVIIITTKRGLIAKPQINFRAEYSLAQPQRVPEFVDSWTYIELANEAHRNDGMAPYNPFDLPLEEVLANYRNGVDPDIYPNANWIEEMMAKVVQSQRYTLNFRGGTENAKYFVSLAYYNQDGVFKKKPSSKFSNDFGFERYNLRSNIDLKVSKTTNMTVDLSGQMINKMGTNRTSDAIYKYMLSTPPHLFPAVYSDGTVSGFANNGDGNNRNPYNLLYNEGYLREWEAMIQTNLTATQDLSFITTGLSANAKFGFDYNGSMGLRRRADPFTYNAQANGRDENGNLIFKPTTGEGTGGFTEVMFNPERVGELPAERKIYLEGSLNYERTFRGHDVSGLILYTQRERQKVANNLGAEELLPYRKQSVVGRAKYSYKNRYFLEASFGATGSDEFAKGHRWGIFPSVGVSYFISNEPFYPEALKDVLSSAKVRLSWGRAGNDAVTNGRFPWVSTYTLNTGYNWQQGWNGGGTNGIGDGTRDSRPANPMLRWEIETKRNIGLDLGFWNNAIQLTVDYFNYRRTDILNTRYTIPTVMGLHANPWMNYGITTNKGFDASLTARHQFGDWVVSARGNFTFARNNVVQQDEAPFANDYQNPIGHSIDAKYCYVAERLYTDDDFIITPGPYENTFIYALKPGLPTVSLAGNNKMGPGDIKYADLDGNGVIDENDRMRGIAYSHNPEINYGFGFNVEWKGLYISAFFQGVANTTIQLAQTGGQANVDYQSIWTTTPFSWGIEKSNYRKVYLDRWTPENPSQDVVMPRLHVGHGNTISKEPSTWWLRNGNFLRFKNLEIGYTLPEKASEKIRMNNFRVYLMAQNLHVWDSFDMWDPEGGQSNAGMKWPKSRTFTLGVDFNF